jgi:hypothetical protein
MHVISDHANLKTVNELLLTSDPNWRASLSREAVQNTQKVFKTPENKSKNVNRESKYSKESINRLQLSIEKQQQQIVSRIIEAQQKSQEDMCKKFEKLSAMILDKASEKFAFSHTNEGKIQKTTESIMQSKSMKAESTNLATTILTTPVTKNDNTKRSTTKQSFIYVPSRPVAIKPIFTTVTKIPVVPQDNLQAYQAQTAFGLNKFDTTKSTEVQIVRGYIHKNIKTPNQTSANLKTYDQTLLPDPLDQQKLSIAKCIQNIRGQEASRLTTQPSESNCTNLKSFKAIECSKNYRTISTISSDATKETTMLTEQPVYFEIAK